MNNAKFTYISEFAGAGGACLGLRDSLGGNGGECRLQIEFDPFVTKQNAFELLKLNFPEVHAKGRILNQDIWTVTGEDMLHISGLKPGELDVLQSSAPCQGWSSANTNKKVNDKKNDLFFHSIENIRVTQPKIILFENVKGLTTTKSLRFKYYQIINELKDAGYRVKTWVLNSKKYSCSQSRVRSWAIGVREDLCEQYGVEPSVPDFHDTQIGIKDVLPHLQGHIRGQFDKDVIPANVPVSCITKTVGFKVIENDEPRYPTIEELRVLSTFPNDYDFGDSSFNQVHNRVGNSVLPKMMTVLMEHLYETVIKNIDPLKRSAEQAIIAERDAAVKDEILLDSDLDDFSQQLLAEVA